MKARLGPWGRALAVGAAVVALHAVALVQVWRYTEPTAGEGDGARSGTVLATLISAPQHRTPPPPPRSTPLGAPRAAAVAPMPVAPTETPAVAAAPEGATLPPLDRAEDGPSAPGGLPVDAPEPDVAVAAAPASGTAAGAPAAAPEGDHWVPPPPARLEYEVIGDTKGLSYRAAAVLDWGREGDRYRAELVLRAFLIGAREQRSTGVLSPRGLQPARFEDQARRERWLAFDWPVANGPGRAQSDDGTTLAWLPPGTQDRLGVFVQLGGWMAAADAGQRWRVPVAGLGRLEHWTFEAAGRERVAVPAGTFDTLRVRRVPDGERGMGVELWFSPAVPGLPVRIVLQQPNGDRVDQQLRAWHPRGTPP